MLFLTWVSDLGIHSLCPQRLGCCIEADPQMLKHIYVAEFASDNYFVIVSIQHRDDSFRHYSLSWYKLIRYTDG